MIKAVSVIANDGISYKPQVVRKIKLDGISDEISPEEEGRIISQKAANEITAMMVEAASSGEAKWTHVKGFGVAGKTGTAQIPIAGHYDQEKTIASFVGFAPYDDPEFAMLVTLREPKSSPWASETAAPLWYSIAKDLFLHFGIQPRN
jgi:cell division protein FtsI/penicillin-binding protein 2